MNKKLLLFFFIICFYCSYAEEANAITQEEIKKSKKIKGTHKSGDIDTINDLSNIIIGNHQGQNGNGENGENEDKNAKKKNQQKEHFICQPLQTCSKEICVSFCQSDLPDGLSYVKYVMFNTTLNEAYIKRLEIADFTDFLLIELPTQNKEYQEGAITIKYVWEDSKRLTIYFYESESIVGKLFLMQKGNDVIIQDNLAFIR